MGGLRLWDLVVRLRLEGMNEIRELDSVLDVEDGNVVTDKIPVTLVGIQPGGETTGVSDSVGTTS